MAKSVRLADIANKMGVSNVTVSKALSDKEGVSDELRRKIKKLAMEMGYRPKTPGTIRKGSKTGNIGIIIPSRFVDQKYSFYWDMYERVINWLTFYGYYGILEILKSEDEDALSLPRIVNDNKVDGLIVMGQVKPGYMKHIYEEESIPVIFLDAYNSYYGCDAIISDGYYGMYMVTNYLLNMGHRNIKFVGTISATSSISDRYFGYSRAMLEKGIEVTEEMIIPDRDLETGIMKITLPEKMPTAFACNCDMTAYEIISALKEQGYRVPDDVSVVGFDNYILSEISNPRITTYEVDMDGMAKASAERLIKKINNKNYNPGLKITVGKIIVKDSVKEI
jgi:LacI family transcriptional regulator